MSSIKEIAKYVGISPASVSIYLNDKNSTRVSAKTKLLIDETVQALNYHKNVFASSLATQESRIIGIIIPTMLPLFQNDYTNTLLSGIQTRLSAFGYSMLFFPSSAKSSIEIVKEQLEKSAGCDGYILFSTGFCTMDQIRKNISEIKKTGRPFVTLNIPSVPEKIHQVLIEGLETASGIPYLISKGHQNIVLLLGRRAGVHARFLKNDFKARIATAGIECNQTSIIYGEYDALQAYSAVKEILETRPETTAICSMSDIMAAAAIKAVQESGRIVPDDISVIGRNNSLHAMLATPSITTIDLNMHQAGLSAANLLLDAVDGNTAPQKIIISGTLIERDSVAAR